MHRSFHLSASTIAALVVATVLLGSCKMLGSETSRLPDPDAVAQLVDARGGDRGRVDFFKDGDGLRLEVVARGFEAGSYGMHVHGVGQCRGPGFASAGPHWNPTGAHHGRENPMGAHRGDLPNLVVAPLTIGRATVHMANTHLTGEDGMLDADGAAFVIHAGPDDMKSDPSGNSGARVACGVIHVPDA